MHLISFSFSALNAADDHLLPHAPCTRAPANSQSRRQFHQRHVMWSPRRLLRCAPCVRAGGRRRVMHLVPVQGALRHVLPVLAAATCTRPCPCRPPPRDVEQINIPLLIVIFPILSLYYLYYLDILPHTTDQCFSGIDKSQPSDVYI